MRLWIHIGIRVIIAVVVGAMISSAAAQLAAYYCKHPPRLYRIYLTDTVMGGQVRRTRFVSVVVVRRGYTQGSCGAYPVDHTILPTYMIQKDPKHNRLMVSGQLPSWVQFPGQDGVKSIAVTYAYGWPLRSMRWWSEPVRRAGPRHVNVYICDLSRFGLGDPRWLPTGIVWSGMAANTAIYGGAIFAIMIPCRRMRSALRKRRGLCPTCKYDLCGDLESGCPECGWGRAMK